MRIGIAFDLIPESACPDGLDDRYEEFDKPQTINALAEVLRGEGHDVVRLGDGREFLNRVLTEPLDFVWNLAEGEGTSRSREARVPAVLEMLGIPFLGSDPLTLAVSLDKGVARQLVASKLVPVPWGLVCPLDASATFISAGLSGLGFRERKDRVIVKPCFEGSSKGIRSGAVVDTCGRAIEVCLALARDYRQPILIEEFIAGDEVTVGIVGNGERAEVIGAMRIRPKVADDGFVYSIEVKRNWDERVEYETPARLPAEVMARVTHAALEVYRRLGCRDLARIDFRVRDGVPFFIEANPLPGLAPDWSDLVLLARGVGLCYPALIRQILTEALIRVGLFGCTRPRGAAT